jgi:hypothetical protein
MRYKRLLILGSTILLFCLVFFAQDQERSFREISLVVNIEVPVRVFDSGTFVENLILDDFEVFENGVPQAVQAVYRVNKDVIQRKEEKAKFRPQTKRLFLLFFEVSQYDPRLGDAIGHFMQDVILPTDDLIVVTPTKTYTLEEDELKNRSREDMTADLVSFLRTDATAGNSEYRSSVRDMARISKELSAMIAGGGEGDLDPGIDTLISEYTAAIDKLEVLREVDQLKLLDFARYLKGREEQKYIYLFYEQEYLPRISTKLWTQVSSLYQNTAGGVDQLIADYQDYYDQEVTIDLEAVRRQFADASAGLHFLFVARPRENIPGVEFVERTNDVYSAFAEMSQASGGFAESSNRADLLFQRALAESENYYIVYYAPKHYIADGQFKEITVKIKDKKYKVIHRAGYFAN